MSPNTIPDDLLVPYQNDVYVHAAMTKYLAGGSSLVEALVPLVAAMHSRHQVMIRQLENCRAGQKPYWAGDNWMPAEEGER